MLLVVLEIQVSNNKGWPLEGEPVPPWPRQAREPCQDLVLFRFLLGPLPPRRAAGRLPLFWSLLFLASPSWQAGAKPLWVGPGL